MDFVKKDWQFRDIISEDELNRIEDGVEEGVTKAEQAQQVAENHANRHAIGGNDPLTPDQIGAETPAGAQAKADAAIDTAKQYTDQQIDAVNDEIEAINNKLDTQDVRDITISERLSIVHTDQATPLHITKLEGRTVVNRLGKQGNFYNEGGWVTWGGTSSIQNNVLSLVGSGTSNIPQIYNGNIGGVPSLGGALLLRAKVTARTEGIKSLRIYLYRIDYGRFGEKVIDLPTPDETYHLVSAFPVTQSLIDAWNETDQRLGVRVAFTTEDEASAEGKSVDIEQVALYDIPSADVSLDETALDAKYPYVDSMQNLSGFYLKRYGKNLIPPFNEWDSINTLANVIEPYKLELTSDAPYTNPSEVVIPCLPNQTYSRDLTRSRVDDSYMQISTLDAQGNVLTLNTLQTFTTEYNATHLRIRVYKNQTATGVFVWENPMLNLGSEPLPFEPQNSDYLFADVELASNANAKDVLEYRDGRYWKVKRFNKIVLDGSYEWRYAALYAGWRTIAVPKENGVALDRLYGVLPNVVRYDGLPIIAGSMNVDGANIVDVGIWNDPDNLIDSLGITVADEDSGWVSGVEPNSNAIKALMNGWRATANDGTVYTAWESILNPSETSTDEQYVANYKAAGWTGWATLQYQLADSVVEDVTDKVEGAISLHDGDNLVEMGEAVVVREDATPSQSSTGEFWIINDTSSLHAASALRYPVEDFVAVYRNGQQDSSWEKFTGPNTNGKWKLRILSNLYDPSASYSVTYIAEPYQYSANAQSVDVQYTANVKTALDRTIQDVADLSTRVSTFPSIYARKHQEQWIEPTLLNGWTHSSSTRRVQYYKDEFGVVRVAGRITGGTTAAGVLLFKLPPGYRPGRRTGVPVTTWNTSTDTKAALIDIDTDGSVLLVHTVMGWLEVSFTFRAEQ